MCVCVCLCIPECMLIIVLLHVMMFWVAVLGGISVSLHMLTNEHTLKQGKGQVYTPAPFTAL